MIRGFYCVWRTEASSPPEDQLMGVCDTEADAKALVDRFANCTRNGDRIYYTCEEVDKKGEVQG